MIDTNLIQQTAAREAARETERLKALDRQARADAGGAVVVAVVACAFTGLIVWQLLLRLFA